MNRNDYVEVLRIGNKEFDNIHSANIHLLLYLQIYKMKLNQVTIKQRIILHPKMKSKKIIG